MRNGLRMAISILALGVCMNVEAGFLGLGNSASWQEEVLLNDGRKIVVERSQSYGGYPTIDSRERMVLDEEWTFENPDNHQPVTWKVNHRRPPEGESLMLMILGFVNGTPYIATVAAGCIAYNHWGRPNPPYIFFRFDGKAWQRITLAEFPMEFKEANVVVGRPRPPNRSGILTVATVQEDNRPLEPHLRQLAREPVKSAQTTDCEELIHYKCGWISPHGTFGRNFMDKTCK
jgi:hypothetical protein